ncbi:MAG: hypothetical protein QW568_03725 [Candidatus Anstonellaceae archaeon]
MARERIAYALFVLLVVFGGLAFATMDAAEQAAAKQLTDSNASCGSLSDSQLELIGEYYMEQMHPGQAHDLMHRMMGLAENSTQEKAFHISLAKTMYCEQGSGVGMMGMMPMMMGGYYGAGMMGRGIMGYGTTGSLPGGFAGYGYAPQFGWSLSDVLVVILLIGLIVLVYAHAWKVLKGGKEKK